MDPAAVGSGPGRTADQERISPIATPPRLDDPGYVRAEYADDARLSKRTALWAARLGPQPQDMALHQIVRLNPVRVLEVGCGQGAFAQRLRDRDYIRATRFAELAAHLPALPDGLTVTAAGTVFVATTASE